MKVKLPQYSGKDYLVLTMFVLPFTIAMNSVIFEGGYFHDWAKFLLATLITMSGLSIDFILCGFVAVLLKNRLPRENQVAKRLTLMILIFLGMTGIFLLLLFRGYERIAYFHYTFDQNNFTWAYIGMGIGNIFLTFLHEGISRHESWKNKMKETEELKKANRQSRLQGLKSQVNPHFLFNSLNSLSSLISEDEEKAEKFLDELSKVYRYMLRNDDDELVTLETELRFVISYFYVLKARYGDGLLLTISVGGEDWNKWLLPLTLQTIIENAFTQNTMTRDKPLKIVIEKDGNRGIAIRNTIQAKLIREAGDMESGIDNLVNRYHLFNQSTIVIEDQETERIIRLPLFSGKEEVAL